MSNDDSDFEALEKQLAKDALEKALKALYGEITKETLTPKRIDPPSPIKIDPPIVLITILKNPILSLA